MQRRVLAVFFLVVAGCGQRAQEPRAPLTPAPAPAKPAARTSLSRAEVTATVKAGLGRFLQKVDVEPSFDAGKFNGFRLVQLRPPSFWAGVDLKPGDVVTSVNGMPIERETQAYDAFQSLLQAKELRVAYLRDGKRRELVYPITGDEPAAAQ